MGEAENRQTVERVFQALAEGQVDLFHAQFHEDSVIEFPKSGERIAGGESRRAVYRALPGRPSVRRIVSGGDLAVVEAAVDYGDGSAGARSSSTSSATGRSRGRRPTGLSRSRPPPRERNGSSIWMAEPPLSTNETWAGQMPDFAARFRVIAPERRGHTRRRASVRSRTPNLRLCRERRTPS